MPVAILDIFEAKETELYLTAANLSIVRQNMVPLGLGDIVWNCGHMESMEHKTIEQAMTEMGGRLDEQLVKHSQHADNVSLVIDGVVTPVPNEPACYLYKYDKLRKILIPDMIFKGKNRKSEHKKIWVSWEAWQAYKWRLDKEGFTVYEAPHLQAMCLAVSAYIHNSLKPEADHKTFKRFIKTRPIIHAESDTAIFNYIKTLMVHTGIGEETARRLLDIYKTPWQVYRAHWLDGDWPSGEVIWQTIQANIGKGVT